MNQYNYHFGLVGFPLGHSLSPALHRAAFSGLGLTGEYSLFPIPVTTDSPFKLAEVLNQIRSGVLSGVNITIPYKQTVIPLLDDLTSVALATGAVNTIFMKDNHLHGENTDVTGFGLDLLDCGLDYLSNPDFALVLGAGGAARAVAYTLAAAKWKVTIAARRPDQAERLSQDIRRHLNANAPTPILLSEAGLKGCIDKSTLIVNTTPLGMAPNINSSPWPKDLQFPSQGFIYDLVYNPSETYLLHQAHAAGLATRNGLGMLVRQAAASFERWTGMVPPLAEMRKSVENFNLCL